MLAITINDLIGKIGPYSKCEICSESFLGVDKYLDHFHNSSDCSMKLLFLLMNDHRVEKIKEIISPHYVPQSIPPVPQPMNLGLPDQNR